MNNNDLIDRALVLECFDEFCAEYPARLIEEVGEDMQAEFTANEIAEVVVENARALRCVISLFPAVEQPLSAVEYERISRRFSDWCGSQYCGECDFHTDCPQSYELSFHPIPTPEQWVAFIQKWAQEHPEEVEE